MQKKSQPHPLLQALIPIADGVAKTIGKNCEVAIHDFSHPTHSIFYVANGEILGRKAGDTLGSVFSTFLELAEQGNDSLINYGFYENGHSLKCSKIFIRDENDVIIGCFCINIAIDEQLESLKLLQSMCETTSLSSYMKKDVPEEPVENDINELVKGLILNSYDDFVKNGMNDLAGKKEFVQFLTDKGVFNVKGSVEIVADLLNVSKYTIYRYINENS